MMSIRAGKEQMQSPTKLIIKTHFLALCFPHGLQLKQQVVYIRSALISEVPQKLDDDGIQCKIG